MAHIAPFVGCHVHSLCYAGATVDGTSETIPFKEKYCHMEFHIVSFFMVWDDQGSPPFIVSDVDDLVRTNNLFEGSLYGWWCVGIMVLAVCLLESGGIIGYSVPCLEQETTGLPPLVPPSDSAFTLMACVPFWVYDQPLCHGHELYDPCGHVWLLFLAIRPEMASLAVPTVYYSGPDLSDGRGFSLKSDGHFL